MTRPFEPAKAEFYLTQPAPCPYLPDREERKIFSFLSGQDAALLNAALSQRGFRRSQNIIYTPSCEKCAACIPVRVNVADFRAGRSHRRTINRNAALKRNIRSARATSEQFSVLRAYLDTRHAQSGMSEMTALDYTSMVEHTAVDTVMIEYRASIPRASSALIGCSLTDRLEDGLSMVYSFFDPDAADRSPGTYMILDHIALAQELNLPYVYLGYWIEGSAKMDYKKKFRALECLVGNNWQSIPD